MSTARRWPLYSDSLNAFAELSVLTRGPHRRRIRRAEAAAARGFINCESIARLHPFLAHLRDRLHFDTLMQDGQYRMAALSY